MRRLRPPQRLSNIALLLKLMSYDNSSLPYYGQRPMGQGPLRHRHKFVETKTPRLPACVKAIEACLLSPSPRNTVGRCRTDCLRELTNYRQRCFVTVSPHAGFLKPLRGLSPHSCSLDCRTTLHPGLFGRRQCASELGSLINSTIIILIELRSSNSFMARIRTRF